MNLKYDTNDPIYEPNRITVMKHRLVVAQGVGVGEEGGRISTKAVDAHPLLVRLPGHLGEMLPAAQPSALL